MTTSGFTAAERFSIATEYTAHAMHLNQIADELDELGLGAAAAIQRHHAQQYQDVADAAFNR